jgi:hypothetical protein
MQCSKKGSLFITSSASASSDGGTVSPEYIGRHVVDGWLEPSRLHDRQLGLLRADWLNQSGQARLRRRHRQYVVTILPNRDLLCCGRKRCLGDRACA